MKKERLLIIGSGPAGLTAAIYAARAGLNPLVIDGPKPGGQLMGTTTIENWPGESSIMGPKLMENMRLHAEKLGTRFLAKKVTRCDFSNGIAVQLNEQEDIAADALIIATGATPRKLNVPGEQEYWGKGVTTCAVCDGAFYKDKPVVIVGGGDSAMEAASFMTTFTNNITVVHIKGTLTASQAMQQRVLNNPDIKVIYNTTISAIHGDGIQVTRVETTNQQTQEKQELPANAVFVAIGLVPNTDMLTGQIELNDYGFITVTDHTKTSQEGVFAAGDVADPYYRQAITSAGAGCMAALDAEKYLKKTEDSLQ